MGAPRKHRNSRGNVLPGLAYWQPVVVPAQLFIQLPKIEWR